MTEYPNILLIILDSTRAQNTSLHGYKRKTTPFLEKFGKESTVYRQARAPSIHSIASHVSMFTGMHVEEHQAIHHTAQIDESKTIWHQLESEFDYTTGLFTNNRIISSASNLSSCFNYVHKPYFPLKERFNEKVPLFDEAYYPGAERDVSDIKSHTKRSFQNNAKVRSLLNCVHVELFNMASYVEGVVRNTEDRYSDYTGDVFTDAFLNWVSNQQGPWASCLNLMDTHSPFEPKKEYDQWADEYNWHIQDSAAPSKEELLSGNGWEELEALKSLYDGTILQADSIIEDLISELDERDILSNTVVIITSDHGEGFGERSQVDPAVRITDHSWGIHEVLTHVPLLIRTPSQEDGKEVTDVVSLTDMADYIYAQVANKNSIEYPTNDIVYSSTYRLLSDNAEQKYSHISDIEKFVGPWRAIYETDGDTVRKYAKRGGDSVTLEIDRNGNKKLVDRYDDERVDMEYSRLKDKCVLRDQSREIEPELEEHLEHLGYVR